MDLRKLKTLVDLVSESNIAELEITEADGKVRIVKAGAPMADGGAPLVMTAPADGRPRRPRAAPRQPRPSSPTVKTPTAATPSSRRWSAPSTAPPRRAASRWSKWAAVVKAGEPLCIIEAMKIMNEIEADVGGSITKLLAENGQAVEFGQPLFVIDRRG